MNVSNTLAKRKIDATTFEVVIATTLNVSKLEIDGEPIYISDEDLAEVIRAVLICEEVEEFVELILGIDSAPWSQINTRINELYGWL